MCVGVHFVFISHNEKHYAYNCYCNLVNNLIVEIPNQIPETLHTFVGVGKYTWLYTTYGK